MIIIVILHACLSLCFVDSQKHAYKWIKSVSCSSLINKDLIIGKSLWWNKTQQHDTHCHADTHCYLKIINFWLYDFPDIRKKKAVCFFPWKLLCWNVYLHNAWANTKCDESAESYSANILHVCLHVHILASNNIAKLRNLILSTSLIQCGAYLPKISAKF